MIQAPLKPIEVKAPERVKSSSSESKVNDRSRSPEKNEFKSELKAAEKSSEKPVEKSAEKVSEKSAAKKPSVSEVSDSEVKAVQVSSEQSLEKPSSLINESAEPEAVSPEIFDPELTQDVDKLFQPKTVGAEKLTDEQIAALADTELAALDDADVNQEIAQAMLKSPKLATAGRAPSIDFAKAEVDPQLMNMEDFVAQKNLAAKKPMVPNAYGMNKPQVQKMALENGLKQDQVISDVMDAKPMNSQQFILNQMKEQNGSPKMNGAEGPQKVFDMSHIKSTNSEQIMNQISDYIVQAKAAKEPTVSMRVNHQDLGMIDITVAKTVNSDALAINIGTHSIDGKNFFQQNSKELFSHLTHTGINVSDLKVDTPANTAKNNFDMSGRGQQQGGTEKQFGSEQNQRRHDSDRRQDLWKLLNKEAA